jgi:solute carrier family 39 (zinc transporter), member 1/2/3
MIAMLVIFFVEFASSRYLAQIDEKVMAMQLRESGSQNTVIEPVTKFLTRRKVVINGRQVGISAALAGEATEATDEIFVRASHGNSAAAVVDEESALLDHQEGNGVRKDDSSPPSRGTNSVHRGHHHYDPPPLSGSDCPGMSDATRKSQLLAVAIMEGGLCFHSIFVGLTLAVATGGEFISLLSAIMFHRTPHLTAHLSKRTNVIETFEGMGLGARIATLSFPRKSIRPYCMGMAFAVVTPIGMAIGLSIRTLYSPTSAAALITNGVFDSISSGLLIYASLVELLAHEFLMGEMRLEGLEKAIFAGVCIVAGAAAMSFLGLWV